MGLGRVADVPVGRNGRSVDAGRAFVAFVQSRAWLAYSAAQPHLVEGIDQVLRRFGGTAKVWRVDQMAAVISPQTRKIQASFAPVAKHYGVTVVPCPPRRGNRKGVVEKQIHFLTQRRWRALKASSLAEAQVSLDRFCATIGDARRRGATTVGELGDNEPPLGLPELAYPANTVATRTVAANALVSVHGNRYSVPPPLAGVEVKVRRRPGSDELLVVSPAGAVGASDRVTPRGVGRIVRLPEQTAALENVAPTAFTTDRPCPTNANRPPSGAAVAIAAGIGGDDGASPVIDLSVYQHHIGERDGAS